MDVFEAMAARRSVRRYADRPVEQDKLAMVVETANRAPVAGDFQVTVIQNRSLLEEINTAARVYMRDCGNSYLQGRIKLPGYEPLYRAPVLALFSAPDGPNCEANSAAAAVNVTLAATAAGLGSCYVVTPVWGLSIAPELTRRLDLPDGYKPRAGVLLGYADGNAFTRERAAADNIRYII